MLAAEATPLKNGTPVLHAYRLHKAIQSEQNRSDPVWSFRILTMPPDHLSGVRPTAMLCGAGRVRRRAWPGGGESTWRSFDAKPVEASSLGYRGYRVHCIITVIAQWPRVDDCVPVESDCVRSCFYRGSAGYTWANSVTETLVACNFRRFWPNRIALEMNDDCGCWRTLASTGFYGMTLSQAIQLVHPHSPLASLFGDEQNSG